MADVGWSLSIQVELGAEALREIVDRRCGGTQARHVSEGSHVIP